MKNIYIYALKDPDTDEIRYIGKTDNLKRRYEIHVANVAGDNTYRKRWINKLLKKGKRPKLEIIETTSPDKWEQREIYWINHHRINGARLTNIAIGGKGGGAPHTKKARRKISKARKGMRFTKNHRDKLRRRKIKLYQSKRGKELATQYSKAYGVLTDKQVVKVCLLAHQGNIPQYKIAELYNIPQSTVSDIKTNKAYKHVKRPIFLLFER